MDQYADHDETRPVRYAARQPILAEDETVVGYKLLFRTDVVDHFSKLDSRGDGRTAVDMSSLLGLDVLSDNRLAFISCGRETLLDRQLAFLPADKVVAEIQPDVCADEAVREACRELKMAGGKIALGDFSPGDPRESMIDLADFLKIDMNRTSWNDVVHIARTFGNDDIGLIADKVETRQDFDNTRKAGFQLFQGYFFRKPETMRSRCARSSYATYLQLLRAVSKPDMCWREVEDLIKRDTTLYYRLLRYLNSAAFGLRGEIRSVNQALTILGEDELRRWFRLVGVFEMSKNRPSDLMLSALVRARFGELIADRVDHAGADLFLVGLLSLMDSILEIPMNAVVEGLPLDAESMALLLENEGRLLPIYQLIWSVERGAWRSVVRACAELQLNEQQVAESYTEAMGWAQAISAPA